MNYDTALRPRRFSEYVGQPALLDRLRILVGAARSRNEPLAHLLLSGPPGLGKTTLAHVIATEMGTQATIAHGPGIDKPSDLYGLLSRLEPGDILFIDEIHRLAAPVAECLYPAMEDRLMTVMIDCRTHTRAVTLNLHPFTLIGATTQPGLLEAPLRDRFDSLNLEFYSVADLSIILTANAHKLGLAHDPAAITLLAGRCRGTPRIANHLLRFARDVAAMRRTTLTVAVAEKALAMQGIDHAGLSSQDRDYLRILISTYGGGPVGAQALAATMGVTPDTVAGVIESYLLQQGFIARTQRGRKATQKAFAHLTAA